MGPMATREGGIDRCCLRAVGCSWTCRIVAAAIRGASVGDYSDQVARKRFFGFERATTLEDRADAREYSDMSGAKDARRSPLNSSDRSPAGYNRITVSRLRVCGIGWRSPRFSGGRQGRSSIAGSLRRRIQREAKRVGMREVEELVRALDGGRSQWTLTTHSLSSRRDGSCWRLPGLAPARGEDAVVGSTYFRLSGLS